MGTALIIALVLILVLFFVSKGKNGTESTIHPQESQQPAPRVSSYVSVEHAEYCDKVYFCSTWICSAIRDKIGNDSITMYDSDKKANKSYVKKMEQISTLHFRWREYFRNTSTKGTYVDKTREETILSPCEGYILYHPVPLFCNGSTFLLASFYQDYETLLKQEFAFDYLIKKDDQNNVTEISWVVVNGETTQYLWLSQPRLKISFNLRNDKPFLLVWFQYKGEKGEKGEQIEFRFDNRTSLYFPLKGKATKDGGIIVSISPQDIEVFASKQLKCAQVSNGEKHIEYSVDSDEQESVVRFAKTFKQVIESIADDNDYEEWCEMVERKRAEEEELKKKEEESCWVYLMHDLANNAYKIGISNKPEYRERTLQSEKPSIEKLAAKQFPTRAIAKAFEASLHKVYAMRHMRGEWFKLEPNEVEDVKKALE